MLRIPLLSCCLLGLATTVALAAPATAQRKPLAMRNQRLLRGNFTPVYKTYRYHSKPDRPFFSFLHLGGHSAVAKHRSVRTTHPSRKHTTGIF